MTPITQTTGASLHPTSSRPQRTMLRPCVITALVALLLGATGCQQMAILWYHATGGETINAKYKLTEGRLAVIMDDREGLLVVPATYRDTYEKLEQEFTANKVLARVVPFDEWQKLRKSPAYDSMSIREIGEKLGADEVLYMKVTDFRLRREPGAPLFQGRFAVRVSVLSTERKRDVRKWPQQEGGEEVVGETKPESSEGDTTSNDVARELATDVATKVAKLFYDHKEKT